MEVGGLGGTKMKKIKVAQRDLLVQHLMCFVLLLCCRLSSPESLTEQETSRYFHPSDAVY